ncbi:P-II family nitrogen regulator [Geobacter sp. SVR]|uniref:P-II family nitrogen regulator n=1 Tax=Geobacter sp. SVR TaxID=2495594 RepID=UPI00143EF6A0|nr:P-II family nitrogen regulator [Geobacter sp. SVR]BCS52830.1 nitrogen regulatory protein P-II 1 [Geobacter sp. SVR]GCF86696.1 nitrogen regulatory protein P-II [Geobacter sp. SVR]
MKQVIAYIKPAIFERVTEALRHIDGLTGMSAVENNGFGRGKGANRRKVDSQINYFSRNIRIEIMVSDALVWEVVDSIRQQAWTGEQGEGKIYVLDVVEAVRIRTNERGEAAV